MSATVLAPVALLAVWFGDWAFLLVLSAAVALLANEWSVMSARKAPLKVAAAIMITLLAALFAAFRAPYLGGFGLAWTLVAASAVISAIAARLLGDAPEDAAFGALYIGVPCIALFWLRDAPQGRNWTFLLLAVTWAADIAAFAVGSLVKGPKLWPRFSPNKTWSGFAGGLVAAVAASMAVAFASHLKLSMGAAALMGLVGGLATMGGDLLESILKRRFGVKDSGDLIPGHGGLLDRVDGLMFAILAIAAARLIHLAGWAA